MLPNDLNLQRFGVDTLKRAQQNFDYLDDQNGKSFSVFRTMTPQQKTAVNSGSLIVGVSDAIQTAILAAINEGYAEVVFPRGRYLLDGANVSPDGKINGFLLPFDTVNFELDRHLTLRGVGGAIFYPGAPNMIMARVSRNCVDMVNMTFDANGVANTWALGIVPESMIQTTQLVSQMFFQGHNLRRVGAFEEGIVIQPGPSLLPGLPGQQDSGCFYHAFYNGVGNLIGGRRHVWLKKGVDFALSDNRPTRTLFFGERLIRGNTGYQFDCGSEIELHGCFEEIIVNGAAPNATPVARFVSPDAEKVSFYGGHTEFCSQAFVGSAKNNVFNWGYIPASGGDNDMLLNAFSMGDGVSDDRAWTPIVNSSGGGAQGASTSTGRISKVGKNVLVTAQISVAKGTLAAGTLSVSGLPVVADPNWQGADFQYIPAVNWNGITLGANFSGLQGYVAGATIVIRKLNTTGAGPAGLLLAECADPIRFTLQGIIRI